MTSFGPAWGNPIEEQPWGTTSQKQMFQLPGCAHVQPEYVEKILFSLDGDFISFCSSGTVRSHYPQVKGFLHILEWIWNSSTTVWDAATEWRINILKIILVFKQHKAEVVGIKKSEISTVKTITNPHLSQHKPWGKPKLAFSCQFVFRQLNLFTCTRINKYPEHCQNGTGSGLSGANYTLKQFCQIQQTKCQTLAGPLCIPGFHSTWRIQKPFGMLISYILYILYIIWATFSFAVL